METENGVNNFRSEFYEIFSQWWRLPVLVRWIEQNDVAQVSFDTGIPLLKSQVSQLHSKFSSDRFDGQFYWVLRSKLESIGHKTERENLEDCVIWNPPPAKVTMRSKGDPDTDEMLARLVEAGYFKSIEQADAILRILRKAMLDQLLNHKKPVDLGFVKLWPVPYRSNWKQVLRDRDTVTDDRFEDPSLLMMFKKFLPCKDRVKETHSRKYVHLIGWTIEIEYSSLWWKMVHAVEMQTFKRMRTPRDNKYGLVVLLTMRKFKATSERLYRQFLQQVSRPIAHFCMVRATGHPIFVQSAKPEPSGGRPSGPSDSDWADNLEAELLGEAPVDRPQTAVIPRPWREVCAEVEVQCSDGSLSGMSDLQYEPSNLRDSGADVVEPNQGS